MEKLNANKILNIITSIMYYDEFGNIKNNLGISEIKHGATKATILLEDGREFTITIDVK